MRNTQELGESLVSRGHDRSLVWTMALAEGPDGAVALSLSCCVL